MSSAAAGGETAGDHISDIDETAAPVEGRLDEGPADGGAGAGITGDGRAGDDPADGARIGARESGSPAADVTDGPLLYREVQRFLWWVILPVAIVTGIIWWTFAKQILMGQPVGEKPIPDWLAWVLTLVFGIGLPALAGALRLVTEVRPGVVSVRLSPFRVQPIPLQFVRDASVRRYSAAREYGGYGVRKGWMRLNIGRGGRNGWAYTARGDRGVQLVLTNGLRILIGSQQPERLLSALRTAGGDFGPKKTQRKKRAAAAGGGSRSRQGAQRPARPEESAIP